MKRTWQPKRIPRKREHGFMKRMSTRNGRRVLKLGALKGAGDLQFSCGTQPCSTPAEK